MFNVKTGLINFILHSNIYETAHEYFIIAYEDIFSSAVGWKEWQWIIISEDVWFNFITLGSLESSCICAGDRWQVGPNHWCVSAELISSTHLMLLWLECDVYSGIAEVPKNELPLLSFLSKDIHWRPDPNAHLFVYGIVFYYLKKLNMYFPGWFFS